ncbi:MAG TPA: hypothetical protein VFR37_13145 [Longimicrobium sp.]|nr:hypothetical protein [Longimicrobium sp.]
MSRSRRHTPIRGITTADSEKQDKRIANRKLRRKVRVAIRCDAEGELPARRGVSNPWCMDKDGKTVFDPARYPGDMRK